MKKNRIKNIILMIAFICFISSIRFAGIKVYAATLTGTHEFDCTANSPYYYDAGTTQTRYGWKYSSWSTFIENSEMSLRPDGSILSGYPENEEQKIIERKALAAGCVNDASHYCVRVAQTCRYKVGGQDVFCLDGETTFQVGNSITYTSTGDIDINKGLACGLVDAYMSLSEEERAKVYKLLTNEEY